MNAIDRLKPESELHKKVLQRLLDRLESSERAMSRFYPRWRAAEIRAQAYVNLEDYEKILKAANEAGEPPKITSIVIPYTFATLGVINTYLLHTFAGRKPYFQVGAAKKESIESAQMMEIVLQYQADYTRMVRRLMQYFYDGPLYGVAIGKTDWEESWKYRTSMQPAPFSAVAPEPSEEMVPTRKPRKVFEGTSVTNINPFHFFPDPRVPMSEVNRLGEFVFWRSFIGRHTLLKAQNNGKLMYVDEIKDMMAPAFSDSSGGESERSRMSMGVPDPGSSRLDDVVGNLKNYMQVDQGTVEIIPEEWGLGDGDVPEKWIFSIGNKQQIIQAESFDFDHDMHPVFVTEPYSMGYGFGQAGIVDYIGPLQDAMSWYWNSHVYNTRYALNNRTVYNPFYIDRVELDKNEPGQNIAMSEAAAASGILPSQAVYQLPVVDVTSRHMDDMQMLMRIADTMTAVNDNLRGVQQAGGRKTATESRISVDAAASRLAALCTLYSAQGIIDLTEQMSLNSQQFMSQEMYINIVGMEGLKTPLIPGVQDGGLTVSPGSIVGDFHYPIHDATSPLDKVAMIDVWQKIFEVVSSDPQLGQMYNRAAILEYMAGLSGAKNLDRFKLQIGPDQMLQQQAQAGNMVPLPEMTSGPGQRMQGGESGGF